MSPVASFRVSMIAVLAPSLCALALAVSNTRPAQAAETCLVAPKSAAPEGSHWYYRLDRATQRKCWHLVGESRKDVGEARKGEAQKGRTAALRPEPQPEPQSQPQPQPQPGAQADVPSATAPLMKGVVQRLTQPFDAAPAPASPAQPPAPPAPPASAGNAFAPTDAAAAWSRVPTVDPATADPATRATVAPNPSPGAADAPPPVTREAQADAPPPVVTVEQPAQAEPAARPAVASKRAPSPDAGNLRMLPFAIGALAAGLLAAALVYASARRRDDAIARIVDLNTREPSRWSAREAASVPLAPTEFVHDHEDGGGDVVQRAPRPRRRHAA